VNDTSVKAILTKLVAEVEDLAASQAVIIATLRQLSKGTLSVADVHGAIGRAKVSNQRHYNALRKAIDEISS
jgi:hypothetical protein